MEHVQGTDLQHLIDRGGVLPPGVAAAHIRQTALALQHAHEAGLVHRDIKPANLLLDSTGVIKVLDLGLARFFNDDQDKLTQEHDSSAILGTADYLAPEQAVDSHEVDIRADIYSLGCTFYFLLKGKAPYHGKSMTEKLVYHQTRPPEPIRNLRPEVPNEMAAVLDRMLAKEPGKRYQTPAEVAAALRAWGPATEATPFDSPSEMIKRRRQARERRSLVVTVGGGLVLLGGIYLFVMLLLRSSAAPEGTGVAAAPQDSAPEDTTWMQRGLKDHWKLDEGSGTTAQQRFRRHDPGTQKRDPVGEGGAARRGCASQRIEPVSGLQSAGL